MRLFLSAVLVLALAAPAAAAEYNLTLKNHRFTPSTIKVKAGTTNVIILKNEDATADEFDSESLKTEKVVAGGATGKIRLRPLAPGRYPFMGEFHAKTAQGVVIAE
ncbi:MAG TPA: cupredoxin domain-containing protein [Rhizomicrobium sp.]|jgi:plastocyanin|nr:cupredoxin domain-containing protein [Rhizomicrobium sp.]